MTILDRMIVMNLCEYYTFQNPTLSQICGYFLDQTMIPEIVDLLLGEEGRGLLDGHRVTGKHACQNHLRTFWSNVADF